MVGSKPISDSGRSLVVLFIIRNRLRERQTIFSLISRTMTHTIERCRLPLIRFSPPPPLSDISIRVESASFPLHFLLRRNNATRTQEDLNGLVGDVGYKFGKQKDPIRLLLLDEKHAYKAFDEMPDPSKIVFLLGALANAKSLTSNRKEQLIK
ncbi:unnamed protein product [Lactuca saligna]|uniref:Uncharacterized protein n=1 Tax=Lactuca saligna TaxID=75948 RepID=A0AA35YHU2_LACSI|nr:unnamed protein product [Lactuca saligna]